VYYRPMDFLNLMPYRLMESITVIGSLVTVVVFILIVKGMDIRRAYFFGAISLVIAGISFIYRLEDYADVFATVTFLIFSVMVLGVFSRELLDEK